MLLHNLFDFLGSKSSFEFNFCWLLVLMVRFDELVDISLDNCTYYECIFALSASPVQAAISLCLSLGQLIDKVLLIKSFVRLFLWNRMSRYPKIAWNGVKQFVMLSLWRKIHYNDGIEYEMQTNLTQKGFMKEKFDACVLWPLTKKFQNWIVDRSTACNFTVCIM